jgi:hypothetical protein
MFANRINYYTPFVSQFVHTNFFPLKIISIDMYFFSIVCISCKEFSEPEPNTEKKVRPDTTSPKSFGY